MIKRLFILLIRFYQTGISPFLPARCRYTPTCSQYAIEAITHFGAIKGLFLTLKRLLRCHPFGGYGFDPVPHNHHHSEKNHYETTR
ncbi:MAG: membrane protein insertion efficiency factor YidD [Neisseriaceae bacterium]|nr:membrane protein insertion efficiency factor YidD [Neisseriaceae bacterium]